MIFLQAVTETDTGDTAIAQALALWQVAASQSTEKDQAGTGMRPGRRVGEPNHSAASITLTSLVQHDLSAGIKSPAPAPVAVYGGVTDKLGRAGCVLRRCHRG